MPQNTIQLKTNFQRWLLLVPAMLIIIGAITGFCWFFGNSIASNAQQADVAEAAARFAPADPLAPGKAGFIKSQSFVPTDLPDALLEYEKAVARAPHDWRYWLALGKMHERLGDAARAEASARRAVELAPNYAQTRWLLGNVLLRRGKPGEALPEMRRAAEADPTFAVHYLNYAAQTTTDLNEMQQIAGDSPALRAALVSYLISEKKLNQAIGFWEKLPETERQSTAPVLANALFAAKRIRDGLPIYTLALAKDLEQPASGKIINGGFESDQSIDVGAQSNLFHWLIQDGAQPNIGFDNQQKQDGARSLLLIFDSVTGQDFRPVSQFVPIESAANYRLNLSVKTQDLKSSSTMQWEIRDAADDHILTQTAAVAVGTNGNWQPLAADFKTANATEAVTIRLARAACSLPPCSISGKVWFDNFSLQKTTETK